MKCRNKENIHHTCSVSLFYWVYEADEDKWKYQKEMNLPKPLDHETYGNNFTQLKQHC